MWYLMVKLWMFLVIALAVGFVTGWVTTSPEQS